MPRTARLDAPGVLHHVMIRGIERRKIFRNNNDREEQLEMSPAGIGFSVERGESIAKKGSYLP